MKRRSTDPLAPLLPVMRVAAVGLVAAAGTLTAVHFNEDKTYAPPPTPVSVAADTTSASIPVTAQLVAAPEQLGEQDSAAATVTDQAEISRVAQIINALPLAPTGRVYCPMDNGAKLDLVFESASGTHLAEVRVGAGGCGYVNVTIDGKQQPTRSTGRDAVPKIQSILGTHWRFTQVATGPVTPPTR